jgi:hypothetical protein
LEGYKRKTFPGGVVNPYTYIEHKWNEDNAQEMVTLKAKEESGMWGASVRDFIMAA